MELNLLTIFISGLLLAFTPCVLPVLPIIHASISHQKKNKMLISAVYVLSMSSVYAVIGLILAYFGNEFNIQLYIQKPAFNIALALLFFILSLSMFDIITIKLPGFLTNKIADVNRETRPTSLIKIAIIGGSSALILSPCITAPLVGILVFVAQSQDLLYGFTALFLLGLGMGIPMILISLGLTKYLPKKESWMLTIKYLFGYLLIVAGMWFLTNSFSEDAIKYGFHLYLIAFVLLVIFKHNKTYHVRAMLISYFIYMGLLLASGITPWSNEEKYHPFDQVSSLQDIEDVILMDKSQNYVLLDFYASWCSPCIAMDNDIFSNEDLMKKYEDNVKYIQIDITDTTAENKVVLDKLGVFGPPTILIFNNKGKVKETLVGKITSKRFNEVLSNLK
jgi:thiol:disulfide interchange protein DsbD